MSWIARAKVGQRIVCVDDDWHEVSGSSFNSNDPKVGDIVTIKDIGVSREMVWFFVSGHGRVAYEALAFRPVTHTQVEALKRLCNPTPEVVA